MPKMTQEAFMAKAEAKAKDNLDLSKYVYSGSANKSIVRCKVDDIEFEMKAPAILNGTNGCPQCGGKGWSKDKFIAKARDTHGTKFDYSNTKYKTMGAKISVRCIEHNKTVTQTAQSHIKGKNPCPDCNGQTPIDREEFIKRSITGHGEGKFDYSHVPERFEGGIHAKVEIRCVEHDLWFTQEAWSHIRPATGCPKCSPTTKKTLEDVIAKSQEVWPNKRYDYSQADMSKSVRDAVKIGCPVDGHGFFEQSLDNHLNKGKEGCPECHRLNITADKDGFIERVIRIHGEGKFGFKNTVIENGLRGRTIVTCLEEGHKDFETGIQYLLQGNNPCPSCAVYGVSGPERELGDWVESLGFDIQRNVRGVLDSRKEVDIWIPEKRAAIEFHGLYWHTFGFVGSEKHSVKADLAEQNNVHLVQVWEDDWARKPNLVKRHLKSVLGLSRRTVCEFGEVDVMDAGIVLNAFHTGPIVPSDFFVGGFVGNKIEFVAGVKRLGDMCEISQFASVDGFVLLDDAARFLIDEHGFTSVVSRMDRCWNDSYSYGDAWYEMGTDSPRCQYLWKNVRYEGELLLSQGVELLEEASVFDAGYKVLQFA